MAIRFFSEGIQFSVQKPQKVRRWIYKCARCEGKSIGSLNYIFCNDRYLLDINKKFLNHDDLTDIITFQYSREPIEGEIYISIDRVYENASSFSTNFEDEFHRVIIHGALHLIGFGDKTNSEKAQMRKKEEAYLSLR